MAAYAELTLDQGTTFTSTLDLAEDDGTPINITGKTFKCNLKKSYYSSKTVANLNITVISAVNGNIKITLDSANTANIKPGRYLYDLKMTTTATGEVSRVLEGIITVTPQVSK